jgi:hypothetical protein
MSNFKDVAEFYARLENAYNNKEVDDTERRIRVYNLCFLHFGHREGRSEPDVKRINAEDGSFTKEITPTKKKEIEKTPCHICDYRIETIPPKCSVCGNSDPNYKSRWN